MLRRLLWLLALPWSVAALAQTDQFERGRYLVEVVADCGACHASRGPDGARLPGRGLAGGWVIEEPGMRAVVPNITPDNETGIGRWTDAQVIASIREGVRPDGSIIGPPMPIGMYRGLSDRDVAAMAAYLRVVTPVRNAVSGRSTYAFPLPPSYGPPVGQVSGPADDPVSRGAYLAGPVAHCMECHSGRRPDMQIDPARIGAQGLSFTGPWGTVVARNITPHPTAGIGRWTDAEIQRALTEEVSADGRRLMPPMARGGVWSGMTEGDLNDLVAYLRSLPPLE